jgi:hypothetical protein
LAGKLLPKQMSVRLFIAMGFKTHRYGKSRLLLKMISAGIPTSG